MDAWSCQITKADNGYILNYSEKLDDDETGERYEVFQEDFILDTENPLHGVDEDRVAFTLLVHGLANFFGINYNKYGEDNLNVTWNKKGSKID